MTVAAADRPTLWRGRIAVALLFLLYGVILGAWTARIPAIKQGLGLSDGQLAIGLLAFAGGAIAGMQLSGRVVDRYGAGRVMCPAALADGVLLVVVAAMPNLSALAVGLFAFGTAHGMLNIAMNAHGVEVQRAWQRPIVSSLHAVYSVGGFVGAAVGGLFAQLGIGAAGTFLAVAAAVSVLVWWAARWILPSSAPSTDRPPAASGRERLPGVWLLSTLVFCCLVGEGAAADWSAVYLRESLGSGPGFAAAAYAAFSIMMMLGRIVGDRLAAAVGPVTLVRGSGALAAVGLATGLAIGHPLAGVIGFGLLGAGLSCIAPQVFSAAGSHEPARAGEAIARVASLGFLGFVVGPVMIGGVAHLLGLPVALTIPAALALFVAATASALRPSVKATLIPKPRNGVRGTRSREP